jgi:hypothetical protein
LLDSGHQLALISLVAAINVRRKPPLWRKRVAA